MLLRPTQDLPIDLSFFSFIQIDKVIHIGIFIVLGLLLKFSFARISFLLFIAITFSYSAITELLQEAMAMGRSMELYDLLADTIGLVVGYFLAKYSITRLQDKII